MTHHTTQTHASERGFTLVELAIVMIIIGLLIGGILKGQELIGNARVSSTVAQVKAIETGIGTFRDKYAALPGDIRNVAARLPNCAAGACATDPATGAGGDGQLANTGNVFDPGLAVSGTTEAGLAFIHMAAAGMIGGVNPTTASTAMGLGTSNPTTPLGGGWVIGTSNGTATGMLLTTGLTSGVYVASSPALGSNIPTANAQVMPPVQAGNIDRKIDDGRPNTGDVRAIGNATAAAGSTCTDANTAAGIYQEAVSGNICGVYAKVQ
ncbi:MAG: prepilin-type N-terminal cleavage/methylation domain-containing protein [Alphaproteobacteria bacterium]|nr:prepilin-type N-terminal cleavage/methylation domain-containing protein [Alphaproteobacteria bacterium]